MAEKDKIILKAIGQAIGEMTDFDKGYLLGKAEGLIDKNEKEEKEEKEKVECSGAV